MDVATRRNLELDFHAGGDADATLLGVLDRTATPMGGRLMRRWLHRPLRDVATLRERHHAVGVLAERATHVILDLTGTDELVEATAKSLLRMAQAIKLLGARCLITGISPQTAKTLGTLHLDLNEVKALPLVSDALASIMNERSAVRQRK